jgi:hypothetical protein
LDRSEFKLKPFPEKSKGRFVFFDLDHQLMNVDELVLLGAVRQFRQRKNFVEPENVGVA